MSSEFHSLAWKDTVRFLRSDVSRGLRTREARRRLSRLGPNKIRKRKRPGLLQILLSQFSDLMVLTLLAATVISALMGEIIDSVVIAAIVLLNAVLGTVQEYKAEESLELLETFTPAWCRVLRDGVEVEVGREEIVPGDIVMLTPGVRVPADGRLIQCKSLQLEEAALTGEAMPVTKDPEVILPWRAPVSERKNMVYAGTLVARGTGLAVVTSTGMNTEMGRIADLLRDAESQKTPLETKLDSLGKILLAICLGICAILAVIGLARGMPFHEILLTAVSLGVAAIPEGLPATVTLCLTMGVQTMARNGAVVRKLEAIETLGSVTVICTDKTGTLTRNQMEIVEIGLPADYGPQTVFSVSTPRSNLALTKEILEIAVIASDARHVPGDSAGAEDPTEQAIIARYLDLGHDLEALDKECPRIGEKSFTPERRMMSVIVRLQDGALVCVKGATDTVIPLCVTQVSSGREIRLSRKDREAWEEWVNDKAARGMRILAVARRRESIPVSGGGQIEDYSENNLALIGCLAMADPLRPEASVSVERCKIAGIRPVLITGDHLKTAESIAREAHILSIGEKGMTGADLDDVPDELLGMAVDRCQVFARVSPAHKLKIVRALKNQGQIVAMTGDGVNDAPALKEAAVGVAMGKAGTDIARESSSMVLLDDNFSTIVRAIEEGRAIYDNIRKFIRYMLSCNLGEVITMTLSGILGFPIPLTPIQILWMNLVTDGLPALALSMDPPDPHIMNRPPRDPNEGIFAHGLYRMIMRRGIYVGLSTVLVFIESLRIWDFATASTMAFATLITVQLVSAIDCRSETHSPLEIGVFSNMYLIGACTISWLMLFATVQVPLLGSFFDTVPLSGGQWLAVFAVSLMPDLFRIAYYTRKKHK